MEKICFEKEKLTELEKQMNFSRERVSRTLKTEEAEMLKRRCLELQDTVDAQRFLVDNLEFQQLEVSFSLVLSASSVFSVSFILSGSLVHSVHFTLSVNHIRYVILVLVNFVLSVNSLFLSMWY